MNGRALGIAAVASAMLAGGGWLIAGGDRSQASAAEAGVKVVQASGDTPAKVAAPQAAPPAAQSVAPTASPGPAPSQTAVDPADADVAAMLPDPADSPDRLYALVRSETRDRNWAQQAETTLRDELARVPHIENTRVRCAATTCEMSGRFTPGLPPGQMNVPMQAMQAGTLHEALGRRGFENRAAMFGSKDGQSTFVLYWRRKA